jgi:hypothetical protein
MVTVFLPWTLPDKQSEPEDEKTRERSEARTREESQQEQSGDKPAQNNPPSEYYLG